MSCKLQPTTQSFDTSQWIALLTAVIWMSTIKFCVLKTQIAYALDTWLVMPGHCKEILA